jgi:hypothetical protein
MTKKQLIIGFFIIGVLLLIYFFMPRDSGENTPVVPDPATVNYDGVEQVSTDFNVNQFGGALEKRLLAEIGICDTVKGQEDNLDQPACSPRFFRFFNLHANKSLSEGFMLLVRAGVNKYPVRRLLIFERENGQLVKVNGFVGYLIERRKKQAAYDDIVVRFFERYENQKYFYNCLFAWNNGRYTYQRCEAINDRAILKEKQDSVSVEVLKYLNENQLIF